MAKRYPLPFNTTPDDYRERLELLISDCGDIDPHTLRAACLKAARECRKMPTAAELRQLAKDAVEDRRSDKPTTWLEDRIRQFNRDNRASDSDVRGVVKGERVETFRISSIGEKRIDGPDGTILTPWFCHDRKEWVYPRADA